MKIENEYVKYRSEYMLDTVKRTATAVSQYLCTGFGNTFNYELERSSEYTARSELLGVVLTEVGVQVMNVKNRFFFML